MTDNIENFHLGTAASEALSLGSTATPAPGLSKR